MNMKQVLQAMQQEGSVLCMEYGTTKEQPRVYWLEPKRILVASDVAQNVIGFPGVVPGGDSLFKDDTAQTWRAENVARRTPKRRGH